MKVTKATAAENRASLLEAAGALYRKRGFAAVNIGDIAAAAGLTHGAVYGHFTGKQDLEVQAVKSLFGWTADQVRGAPGLAPFLDLYLSRKHLDMPEAGCPLAALGGDTAREDKSVRDDFGKGLESLITALGDLADTDRATAITAISTLVGAIVLARATGNRKLSNEILSTTRAALGTELNAA